MQTLKLDMTTFEQNVSQEVSTLEKRGFRFFTLAESADSFVASQKLYPLVKQGILDDPENDDFETFEQFCEYIFVPSYWSRRDEQFLASYNGEWVGLSSISVNKPSAKFGLTVTHRAYRKRGLGRALKLLALKYAAEQEVSEVFTENHPSNHAMLYLNHSLGFELTQ